MSSWHESNKFKDSVSSKEESNKISKQKKKKILKKIVNDSDSNDDLGQSDSKIFSNESSNQNKIKEITKNEIKQPNDYIPEPLFNQKVYIFIHVISIICYITLLIKIVLF